MSNRRDRFQTREKIKDLLGRDISLAQPSVSALEVLTETVKSSQQDMDCVAASTEQHLEVYLVESDQIGRQVFDEAPSCTPRADQTNRDGTSASQKHPRHARGRLFPTTTSGGA